jgi:hypothetical protein
VGKVGCVSHATYCLELLDKLTRILDHSAKQLPSHGSVVLIPKAEGGTSGSREWLRKAQRL